MPHIETGGRRHIRVDTQIDVFHFKHLIEPRVILLAAGPVTVAMNYLGETTGN